MTTSVTIWLKSSLVQILLEESREKPITFISTSNKMTNDVNYSYKKVSSTLVSHSHQI